MIIHYYFFPPHGDLHSALRPRPLTAIFGLAASHPPRRNRFSIRLTANVDLFFSHRLTAKSIFYSPHSECQFIFLSPPHGEIDFLFASRRMSILFSHAPSRRNRFSIRLTANIDFLFASRRMLILFILRPFTALINFLFGSRQEPISFRLHGASCLTAVINVLLASRRDSVSFWFTPDGDIDILSPHGDNWSFFASRRFFTPLQATSSSTRPCRRTSPAISNAPVIELAAPPHQVFGKLLGLLISVGVAFFATRMTGHDLALDNLWFKLLQIRWYLNLGGTPLELVYYGYPQSTYWTGSFRVFLIRGPTSHSLILIKYRYKTSFQFQARYQDIQGSYIKTLTIDLLFCLTIHEWSLASIILSLSPWHQVPDFYSMSFWVHSTLASASVVCLGRVHWNTIWMVGWSLNPSLILGQYWAFHVLMFFLVWYLCARGSLLSCFACKFAHPMSYIFLCWETRTKQFLSMNHFRSILLSTSAISLLYLRYKLVRVHCFITSSLIHLYPGLCLIKPLNCA